MEKGNLSEINMCVEFPLLDGWFIRITEKDEKIYFVFEGNGIANRYRLSIADIKSAIEKDFSHLKEIGEVKNGRDY